MTTLINSIQATLNTPTSENNMNFPLSPEELYDILSDHFMYCEEDSWERNTDLEDMSYEDMFYYYTKYHFAITLGA